MPEQVLQDAEKSGLENSGNPDHDGGVEYARNAENSFATNVTSKNSEDSKKKRKSKVGLKKKGPIIALLALLAVAVVLILVVQGVMPFAVVNRLIEEYNTNGVSSLLRADNVLDVQISSQPHSALALGNHQISALKDNNILPLEYGGGTILAYKKTETKWNVVKGTSPENPSVTDIQARLKAEYSGYTFESINLISLKDAFEDGDFKVPYTTASKTWRGGNSGWYDELAELAETVHGFERSRWFNYETKLAVTNGTKSLFKSMAKAKVGDDFKNTTEAYLEEHEYETGNTNPDTGNPETATEEVPVVDEPSNFAKGLDIAQKFINAASFASDLTCAAVEGFIGVQTLISAYQRIQKINLAAGFMEAVQTVQAGDSSGGPMHEYSNNLMAADPETGKSAMNSAGMGSLFTGTPISVADPSVQSVNTENALQSVSESNEGDGVIMALFKDVTSGAKNLLNAFKICNYVKGGLAVVNMAVTILSVIPIFGQGLKAIQLSIHAVVKAVTIAAISAAAPVIAKVVIQHMGEKLIDDMATEWLGEDLGNGLLSGANSVLSSNHQTGGGSPGSPTKVAAFRQEQQRVIAEEAEYQRAIRSPFDITSGHTFLGNIVYNLIPLATSSGVGSTIKNISSIMTNSVSKLLPTASAMATTEMVDVAKEGDCPILQNMEVGDGTIEIQADAYCNPLYITDQSTIGSSNSINDVIQKEIVWGNIEEDGCGGYRIVNNSELANYIMYCGQRTSSWGLADANIASSISSSSVFSQLPSIPIIGDIKDLGNAATSLANLPWTTGSACVASESNSYWGRNQYHQRYVEDQRLLGDEGIIEKNPVVAYIKDYYEKNPLDNSYEGILARYSGMTKDDVIATLELIDGLNYLANYNPEERYAFGHEKPETNLQFEQTEQVLIAAEPKYVIYNTLRNRAVLV